MSDKRADRERHERLGKLFSETRKLPTEERSTFLESNCDDADLRAEVMALLEDSAGSIKTEHIQIGLGRAAAEVIGTGAAGFNDAGEPGSMRPTLGSKIGPYQLLDVLGEGGFGIVYEAEQTEPVKRHVALKIIKPGMDSAAVIARFTAERQALALMDHPNVAHIFDGGTTPAGLPYFAMELIKGEPITQYADRHRLSVMQRIELFIQICEAVQHAHSKGVIHRDLKPSNLLVENQDGRNAPKVIDFGIAKALSQPLAEATMFTRQGQLIGSVDFMSPEQAELGAADVDTRSDIYSLGAVLYELLSGLRPFEASAFSNAGYSEFQRIIREVDPPRPSARLSMLVSSDDTDVAARCADERCTDIKSLAKILRRDLDWIVMRCMEKDREHRYETANALAMDLRRFLEDEPVLAGPPGVAYRLGKFAKRNRAGVAAGAVAAAALITATGVSIGFAVVAESARLETARRADELRQVADFQVGQLEAIDPTTMGVRLRRSILEAAPEDQREELEGNLIGVSFTDVALDTLQENIFEQTISAIDRQFTEQPLVRAQLLQTTANALRELGLLEFAISPQERALAIRQKQLGDEHPDTLSSFNGTGELLHLRGKLDEAEPYFREALETLRRVLGEEHPDTIRSIANLGALLRAQGNLDDAELYLREALTKRRQVLGDEHPDTLTSLNNLGLLMRRSGRLDEAEGYYNEALQARRHVFGDEHPDTLTLMNNLAAVYWAKGEIEQSELYHRETTQARRRILGENHPATLSSFSNMGVLLLSQGKFDEAEPYMRDALEARRRLLGDVHPSTLTSMNNMGALLQRQGRLDEAEPLLRETLASRRQVLGPGHAHTLITALSLGTVYRTRGDYAESIAVLATIEEQARTVFLGGNAHRLASILMNLGLARAGLGYEPSRFDAADANLAESYEIFVATRGERHKDTLECVQALIDLYAVRNTEEPGEGYGEKIAVWRARLEAAVQK